jgi:hypothetical protein
MSLHAPHLVSSLALEAAQAFPWNGPAEGLV